MRELTDEVLEEMGFHKGLTGVQAHHRDYKKNRSVEIYWRKGDIILDKNYKPWLRKGEPFKYQHELEDYMKWKQGN